MPSVSDYRVSPSAQPKAEDYGFNLDTALSAVVGLSATVPDDAFTAETLGTERAGNGVIIGNGLVLTIGYLITEAESIWLTLHDGRVVPGHVLGYDQATGFGLVQALGKMSAPALRLGSSAPLKVDDAVVVAAHGGRERAVAAHVTAKQEFAGYWEYVLDEAIFTAPAHPHWGGTAVIGPKGDLVGIGSLHLEQSRDKSRAQHYNMVVPIDLLTPILNDLQTMGRANKPIRPWLGVYATEIEDRIVIAGLADKGPAARAKLARGDIVLAVAGTPVKSLADFFRQIWAQGEAGAKVAITIHRDGSAMEVPITSGDRADFLKGPKLQ